MKKNSGFTIIELLVVIAVIGLLASIVLVNMDLPKQRQKARIAKTLEFSQSIQNALGAEAVGIWEFDEGSGIVATDRSGYGNNGTINGAVYTASTPQAVLGQGSGKFALSFDGVDDYVDAGSGASTNFVTEDFTIEFWAKVSGGTLVQRGASQVRGYTLMADPYVHLLTHQAGAYTYVRSKTAVNAGQWQHWVAVKVGTTARLYLNGVENLPYTSLSVPINNPVTAPTDSFQIGKGSWGYVNGLIDEVRIYSQALTIGQIEKHYAEGLERRQNLTIRR